MSEERPSWAVFETLDSARRLQGMALDALGFGPSEASYDTVFRTAGASLRRYRTGRAPGPAGVIVPAPNKRPHICDLAPAGSAVPSRLAAGASGQLCSWHGTTQPLGVP